MTFSDATAVFPLLVEPDFLNENAPARTLDWQRREVSDAASPLEQHFSTGWLRARLPTQFITSRATTTKAHLDVSPTPRGSPQVVNQLGSSIQQLVLIDEAGKCFVGENIAIAQTAALDSVESQSKAFADHINPAVMANRPELPAAARHSNAPRLFGLSGQSSYQNIYAQAMTYPALPTANGMPPVTQATGLFERSIQEIVDQLNNESLPPRTYVAIVDSSPEMELGTPAAREESSLHIIVGHY